MRPGPGQKSDLTSRLYRREGNAVEVADLVVYLAGTESSFITGTNIDIKSGTYFS
ncbi:hypothetical protein [Niastella yeongjuensis]|uniref:hypothetical protein n=1 Tax=Niastella yeongjuensis TaxID=354355 RepID=UPI001A99A303|nr:hypothetical protein [Niastella yeongjuensis]